MNSLYLECSSGISGDMTVAALLDLGADQEALQQTLSSLPVSGFETRITRVSKSGIDACDFAVILDKAHDNHDHDMEYLHGHGHEHSHDHIHALEQSHDHNHIHDHTHTHDEVHSHDHIHGDAGHSHHHHEHRGLPEIRSIIEAAALTPRARTLALKIFTILAEAEARAHGVPIDQVHFHEVGAVDSIVDIVAAAVCIDSLGIDHVIIPSLCEGQGTVRCQHGILPVPVPAVANIVQANNLILQVIHANGEFVTPTGAAIAAALKTSDSLPERFTIQKIGIGAGKRTYERPSILRAMLISHDSARNADSEKNSQKNSENAIGKKQGSERTLQSTFCEEMADEILKLETNIDDCTGEALGYVMEQLLEAGARDVHYVPAFTKKNRPAWILTVLCREEQREAMEEILFRETTTIGIRRTVMQRTILPRSSETVMTPYGEAVVKLCKTTARTFCYPEYESIAALARTRGVPFSEVYHAAVSAFEASGDFTPLKP